MLKIDTTALEAFIEQRVRAAVAEELGTRPEEDPWMDSTAAAEYLGVKQQRIHDLVCSGDLPRIGEKGERLYFRRSTLDAYREGLSLKRGMDVAVRPVENGCTQRNAPAARERSGADHRR